MTRHNYIFLSKAIKSSKDLDQLLELRRLMRSVKKVDYSLINLLHNEYENKRWFLAMHLAD